MSLRVEGGEVSGRRLAAPKGIRPTQGLVRAAIFDALGRDVEEAAVLDLFAGSGALGIEALSRGAARAAFVEHRQACVSILRQNLEGLGMSGRAAVVRADVPRWLQSHPDQVAEAGLLLLDPPYADPVLNQTLQLLDRLVGGEASVVVEHAHRVSLPRLERLAAVRAKRYGDTDVTVLRPS